MLDFANIKLNSNRSARITKVAVGSLAAALCMETTSFASAQDLHHTHHRQTHIQAYVDRDHMATYVPIFRGPIVGTWQYQALTPHCDPSYPMTESAPCGTASGGPVGGIN